MDVEQLEQIAQELICRIRDEPVDANERWLVAVAPEPLDWMQLAFVLAAAVPDDRTWAALTRWTRVPALAGLRPHGTHAAAQRHRYHGEPLCEACRDSERERDRERKRAAYVPRSTGSSTAVDAA